MSNIRAFYDRGKSIEGAFTIQAHDDNITTKVFNRVHTRSGQRGHENTSWRRSKSPIPYGDLWLWTHSINRGMKPGKTGIGEFFFISSDKSDPLVISRGEGQVRRAIGLHAENALPGSAGCIVVVKQDEFEAIATYLHMLNRDGIQAIQLTVL